MKSQLDVPEIAALYGALDKFRERSLRQLKSSFLPADDPDVDNVWTHASASELVREFVEKPDETKRGFLDKLRDQLANISRPAGQLMEELTWLHLVVASKQGYPSKRQLLDEVADIGSATGPSGIFDEVLHTGLAATGTSFFTRRPNQLWLLVRFAERWTAASAHERDNWLSDPIAFRAMVFSLEGVADQTQRHALLHLVHPDSFEDTVSQYHKRKMASLAEPSEEGENDDATIARVRERLAKTYGDGFSFYQSEVRGLWDPEPEPTVEPTTPEPALPEPMSRLSRRFAAHGSSVDPAASAFQTGWRTVRAGSASQTLFRLNSCRASVATSSGRWQTKQARTRQPAASTTSSARSGDS